MMLSLIFRSLRFAIDYFRADYADFAASFFHLFHFDYADISSFSFRPAAFIA
jgi:hypothetical protein